MASSAPNLTGRHEYKIYDYFDQHDDTESQPGFDSWKQNIDKLTKNKMIHAWHQFKTPLKSLGPLGKFVMNIKLSDNHGLYHRYLVFELIDTVSGKTDCAVSFEKLSSGILFQIGKDVGTVRNNCQGSLRKHVKESDSSKKRGFEGQLIKNLTYITNILESRERFDAFYRLLFNNCQHLVSNGMDALVEKSMSLNFQVPGSQERFAINDPKILEVIEEMFPQWKEEKVQRFPDLPNPFAIEVKVKLDENMNEPVRSKYQFLLWKEKVVSAIYQLLRESDTRWSQGRKAILTNLSRSCYEKTLALVRDIPSPIIDQISELWSSTFEAVVVLEAVGIIIFTFHLKKQKTDDVSEMDEKVSLAAKIENIPVNIGKNIHLIHVAFDMDKTKISEVKNRQLGYQLNLSLNAATIDDESSLKGQLIDCFEKLSEAQKPSPTIKGRKKIEYLRKFAARLFVLQNLENEESLIHRRVETQEFGPEGCCILTSRQRQILDEMKLAFVNGEVIRSIISGCYGSGKTMLMMMITREFLKTNKEGNVFILLHSELHNLTKSLQEQVDSESEMKGRVMIGSQLPSDWSNLGLILMDEFFFHAHDISYIRSLGVMGELFTGVMPVVKAEVKAVKKATTALEEVFTEEFTEEHTALASASAAAAAAMNEAGVAVEAAIKTLPKLPKLQKGKSTFSQFLVNRRSYQQEIQRREINQEILHYKSRCEQLSRPLKQPAVAEFAKEEEQATLAVEEETPLIRGQIKQIQPKINQIKLEEEQVEQGIKQLKVHSPSPPSPPSPSLPITTTTILTTTTTTTTTPSTTTTAAAAAATTIADCTFRISKSTRALTTHFVLFTSYLHDINSGLGIFSFLVNANICNSRIPRGWQYRTLDGNLRSTLEISKLVAEFQNYCNFEVKHRKFSLKEIPVEGKLKLQATPAEVIMMTDDSDDRSSFRNCCKVKVENLASTLKSCVVVSCLMHSSLIDILENEMSNVKEKVTFHHCSRLQGCQYPCIVLILDLATTISVPEEVTMIMSRATTSLHIILNRSLTSEKYRPSWRYDICLSSNLELKIRSRLSEYRSAAQEKVWLIDGAGLAPISIWKDQAFEVTNASKFLKATKKKPQRGLDKSNHDISIPALFEIRTKLSTPSSLVTLGAYHMFVAVEKEAHLIYDSQFFRKRIINFFASKAENCIRRRHP